ncbi:VCBS domain-containing protein [Gallaecimonas mangrovi]|uniref:VCBS domain-containing protein n=1 Tax=Gallaecimonas mangrovi TaxID=2291597 RepID=UPI000E206E87|nr:VCBS domain-containing protein [Gallaecimonas mangrovi]
MTTVGTFVGSYGTLTLYSDGNYSYALDNDAAAVQGLSDGESLSDSFDYSIIDNDGDSSTATLTITINGSDDGVVINGLDVDGGEQSVSEANLSDGSAPDSSALTQSGSFSFESVDGLQSVSIGGQSFTLAELQALATSNATVSTDYGTLTLTGFSGDASGGSISYSYTLTDNVDNDSQAGANDSGYTDSVAVVVTDDDGSSSNASLDISITDDVPTAYADSNSVTEDGPVTATGNVLTNDTQGPMASAP